MRPGNGLPGDSAPRELAHHPEPPVRREEGNSLSTPRAGLGVAVFLDVGPYIRAQAWLKVRLALASTRSGRSPSRGCTSMLTTGMVVGVLRLK